jgi:serine/threonine protein kinase
MSGGEVDRPHLKKGQRLNDRYEVMEDINTGSFGHVVLCRDISQGGTKVAVKVQDRPEVRYHQGSIWLLAAANSATAAPPSLLTSSYISPTPHHKLQILRDSIYIA